MLAEPPGQTRLSASQWQRLAPEFRQVDGWTWLPSSPADITAAHAADLFHESNAVEVVKDIIRLASQPSLTVQQDANPQPVIASDCAVTIYQL